MKLATVLIEGKEHFGAVSGDSFIDLGARYVGRCSDIPALLESGLVDAARAYGPWLVTCDEIPEPADMVLTTRLNGEVMQHSAFSLIAWDLAYLVHYVSTFTRLQPGDAISTGTPGGVGALRRPPRFMKAEDQIEVEVTGIGVLRNRVEDESAVRRRLASRYPFSALVTPVSSAPLNN